MTRFITIGNRTVNEESILGMQSDFPSDDGLSYAFWVGYQNGQNLGGPSFQHTGSERNAIIRNMREVHTTGALPTVILAAGEEEEKPKTKTAGK